MKTFIQNSLDEIGNLKVTANVKNILFLDLDKCPVALIRDYL